MKRYIEKLITLINYEREEEISTMINEIKKMTGHERESIGRAINGVKGKKLGKELGIEWYEDEWLIDENETFITGSTYMDNFDFHEFFNLIDVDDGIVIWGDYPFDLIEDIEDTDNEDIIKESRVNWIDILNRLE